MNGFGFIEYEDAMDARDVVPGKICNSQFKSPRLTCLPAFRTDLNPLSSLTVLPNNLNRWNGIQGRTPDGPIRSRSTSER